MISASIEDELLKRRVISRPDISSRSKQHRTIGIGMSSLGVVTMFIGLILAAESHVGLVIDSEWVDNVSALLLIVSCLLLSLGVGRMDKVGDVERDEREVNSTRNN